MTEAAERVRFIEHRGVRILYHDFSGFAHPQDAFQPIAQAHRIVAAQPPRSVRTLVDVRGSHFNTAVSKALQELAAHNKPYVVASAVVGVSKLQRIILYAVTRFSGRTFATFDDLERAKDWLAEQA